jgi:hypothetical protein
MNGKPWTPELVERLRRLYPDMPTRDVAVACGHSLGNTYAKATKLGLKKSAKFNASPASGRLEHHLYRGEKTRFPKGHVPANKGLRRPGWGPGRMKATQFKSGERPHTWKPIGTEVERKDGYIWVKVSDDAVPARLNWISKHEAVWVKTHGPIPPGHIVTFKDRDKRNFADDNLELITLADNLRRNGIHRYPPELVRVIQLRGAVQRQINKRQPTAPARRGRPPKRQRTTEAST